MNTFSYGTFMTRKSEGLTLAVNSKRDFNEGERGAFHCHQTP